MIRLICIFFIVHRFELYSFMPKTQNILGLGYKVQHITDVMCEWGFRVIMACNASHLHDFISKRK